jgi:hypothetical protein
MEEWNDPNSAPKTGLSVILRWTDPEGPTLVQLGAWDGERWVSVVDGRPLSSGFDGWRGVERASGVEGLDRPIP